MPRPTFKHATTATALALLVCMGGATAAEARSAHVHRTSVISADGHAMKVRGVVWGGGRFVPADATATLPNPDVSTASRDFKRIQKMGANLVRVDVSSAANDDAHRLAFQKLQRLAKAHSLQILFANVPLTTDDQSVWLQTLASWFPQKPNVWYLPETDPSCGLFTAGQACGDTEAWIWTQSNDIRALRAAGVRTPIVINLPDGSRSASVNWVTALSDRNLIFGVHPSSGGHRRFTSQSSHALNVSLRASVAKVPVIFDRIGRVHTTVDLLRSGTENMTQWSRSTSTTTDSIKWSQGLLDWATGWTLLDGGDGAVVDGFATSTQDQLSVGRKRFTKWGRAAASGYFAITYRAQAGRDPGTNFPGGFELGDRGPGVRALQSDLAQHGYLGRNYVSGVFDAATWQGIVAFQGYNRVERTGIASAETIAMLMQAEDPVPRYANRGKHIEVDIARGIVMLVNADGTVKRVIHTSTGATGNTPDGEFTIGRRELSSWDYKFKIWLPYAQYFHEGFALHEYPDVPAYPASHGCVRMEHSNASVAWDFGAIGMPVILYHSH